jgi:hypothetical protein
LELWLPPYTGGALPSGGEEPFGGLSYLLQPNPVFGVHRGSEFMIRPVVPAK